MFHNLALDAHWAGDTIGWPWAAAVVRKIHVITLSRVLRHPLAQATALTSVILAMPALLATAAMASIAQTTLDLFHLHTDQTRLP